VSHFDDQLIANWCWVLRS